MGSLISVQNISVKYERGFAVKDVSFSVEEGDYLCIVGENGSGKTTLMKTVLGLIKPGSGTISFQGLKQNQIGYIPQQTSIQKDFPTSVYEVVLSGCLGGKGLFPFYNQRDKALALDSIRCMGAEQFTYKAYSELSGGQKQRVLLARALCAADKILLLDEPASGLDPKMAEELYGLLELLNRRGITIVMISHDMSSAVKYAGKVLHMQNTVLFYGSKTEYEQSAAYCDMSGGTNND